MKSFNEIVADLRAVEQKGLEIKSLLLSLPSRELSAEQRSLSYALARQMSAERFKLAVGLTSDIFDLGMPGEQDIFGAPTGKGDVPSDAELAQFGDLDQQLADATTADAAADEARILFEMAAGPDTECAIYERGGHLAAHPKPNRVEYAVNPPAYDDDREIPVELITSLGDGVSKRSTWAVPHDAAEWLVDRFRPDIRCHQDLGNLIDGARRL